MFAHPDATIAADPLVPVSSRLALTGTNSVPSDDGASPVGVRPFGLRRARPAAPGRSSRPAWHYDHLRQLAVETATGRPLLVVMEGDPSATTTARTDGEDPPSSEDWNND